MSNAEQLRVLGAVSRARGDWHHAFHALNSRKGRTGEISWYTFVEFANSRTDTYEVRDDDAHSPDIADVIAEALSPADPTPDTDYRVARVQEAIRALPQRQFEAVVRWSVLAKRGVKVRTVKGAKRADSLEDELTDTEARNLRRAFTKLKETLADLATGTHQLRDYREPTPNPHDEGQPCEWESKRQGEPRAPHVDTHAPQRMVEALEFYRVIRPEWTREWIASVPPVPRNWASLPSGTTWRLEIPEPKKKIQITTIQSEDFE